MCVHLGHEFVPTAAGFGLHPAVQVVDLFAGEGERVDGLAAGANEARVAHVADHVDVAALAQVLSGVLSLLPPQRPLDCGGLFVAVLTAATARIADRRWVGVCRWPSL